MKRLSLFAAGFCLALSACYNPELAPSPFLCGAGGTCPKGYKCYGGICMDSKPECMQEGYFFDGNADKDLEPNNHPELATDLPCGDPFSPNYTPCSCPPLVQIGGRRQTYQNGLQGLGICPAGDFDYYRFYLFAGETLTIHLIYRYNLGRDLNLNILQANAQGTYDVKAQARSSNDNEDLEYTALVDDWYYIVVIPANPLDVIDPNTGDVMRPADLNEYILQFVLNELGCNSDGTCGNYETQESCPADCTETPFCGNLVCESGETGCTQDCFCGNGTCDVSEGESSATCPDDCPACS